MAEVGAVYDITAVPRTTTDILPGNDAQRRDATAGPTARNKWLTASVVDDAKTVVAAIFAEAHRRDPRYRRTWIALVDGNNHQIDHIHAEAKTRELTVTILIDFVHVLEYLWKAAWSLHAEGDPAAETWVRRHAQTILAGGATRVAGALRRAATTAGLEPSRRENADTCASYLTSKADYLNYQDALQQGWPIATGIIEGACRHIVKDRLDRSYVGRDPGISMLTSSIECLSSESCSQVCGVSSTHACRLFQYAVYHGEAHGCDARSQGLEEVRDQGRGRP